jgi:hypothetical protein
MLTETILGLVFLGQIAAAAALPILACNPFLEQIKAANFPETP